MTRLRKPSWFCAGSFSRGSFLLTSKEVRRQTRGALPWTGCWWINQAMSSEQTPTSRTLRDSESDKRTQNRSLHSADRNPREEAPTVQHPQPKYSASACGSPGLGLFGEAPLSRHFYTVARSCRSQYHNNSSDIIPGSVQWPRSGWQAFFAAQEPARIKGDSPT